MSEKPHIGFEIHTLDRTIGKRLEIVTQQKLDGDLPVIGAWIIGYIYRRSNEPVYQKDIERKFCIPPSTATKILKQMEKEGYVDRLSVENDARLKKLELTPKAVDLHNSIIDLIHTRVEDTLLKGLSKSDQETLFRLLARVRENAESIE